MNLNDLVEALTGTLPLTAEDCGCGDERVHAALESQFRDITDALVRKLHHRQREDSLRHTADNASSVRPAGLTVSFVDPRYFARMCLALDDQPAVEMTLRDDADAPRGPFFGCAEFVENEDGVITVKLTEVIDPTKLVIGVYLDAVATLVLP